MKTPLEIKKQTFFTAVNVILNKTKMFEDRFVIFEKWIEPSEIIFPKDEIQANPIDNYLTRIYDYSMHRKFSVISWYNKLGELHSYNDMPSIISLSSDFKELELEWHKNGVPFRNNNKFNTFRFNSRTFSSHNDQKFTCRVEWLNKEGSLHSFNDMPALITEDCVSWYWNGENCRMSSNLNELPCSISKAGHMKFKKHKNDTMESINYPFSTKHYGKIALEGLFRYEKYVKWPIRQILTL